MNRLSVTETLGLSKVAKTDLDFVTISREGIPRKSIDMLAEQMQLSVYQLAECLHISKRTLQRYKSSDFLTSHLSDQVIQISKVFNRAVEVFEDRENAALWLKEKNVALGNNTPIDLLDTTSGIDMILDVLGRIEHGAVS